MRHSRRSLLIRLHPVAHRIASFVAASLIAVSSIAVNAQVGLPVLAQPELEPGHETVSFTGIDPGAPRELILYRWDGVRFQELATTRSRADGGFHFTEQSRPIGDVAYHAAVVGDPPDAARLVWLDGDRPGPIIRAGHPGSGEIEILPTIPEGRIEIRDAESRELLWLRSLTARDGRSIPLDLVAEGLLPRASVLAIEQVFRDGQRSESSRWLIEPIDPPR